jgi:hypothetical protein
MSHHASALQRHVVAMTVFVEAEGRDAGDATNVAWRALETAITGGEHEFAATRIVVHTYQGYPRSATIINVIPTTLAFSEGALVVRPAAGTAPQT